MSTKEQARNLSLRTQQEACERFCAREGITVAKVFVEEGESAKSLDRPVFQDLLAYCRANGGRVHAVVVYDLSRFARNALDHHSVRALLTKLGVTLRSVTQPIDDSSSGVMMEGVLAAMAQFDNKLRAERTVAGMKAAIERGRWPFRTPLGYARVTDSSGCTTIVPDPASAPLVKQAFELVGAGTHSKRKALDVVTSLGLRTARGDNVSKQSFELMLANPVYAGWLYVPTWDDIGARRAAFERIVSEELFRRVQDVLSGRRKGTVPHERNHPDFPLRRFVNCWSCGTPLTGSWSRGRGKKYAYYRCRKPGCRGVNVAKDTIENEFANFLTGMRPKMEYWQLFREIVVDTCHERQREAMESIRTFERRIETLLQKKDRIVEAFVHTHAIDERTYRRQIDRLDGEVASAESAAAEARLDELDVEAIMDFAEALLSEPATLWLQASPDQKQQLQKAMFPEGTTYRGGAFGTAATSSVFTLLRPIEAQDGGMASPTGFEPVSPP